MKPQMNLEKGEMKHTNETVAGWDETTNESREGWDETYKLNWWNLPMKL